MADFKIQRNSTWSQWSRLRNRRCPYAFVTVFDNPSKCVLNTLQFEHVETGQTPEETVAVIKATTHQGISRQDSSLLSQVLSNLPEITNLSEACLINVADMISKGEISIKSDTKVLYNNYWMHEITNYPNWEIGI